MAEFSEINWLFILRTSNSQLLIDRASVKISPPRSKLLSWMYWIVALIRLLLPTPGRPIKVTRWLSGVVIFVINIYMSFCLPTNSVCLVVYNLNVTSKGSRRMKLPSENGPKTKHLWESFTFILFWLVSSLLCLLCGNSNLKTLASFTLRFIFTESCAYSNALQILSFC